MIVTAVVYLPNLPVALARRAEPALADQPLVVLGRRAGQPVVVAADAPGVARGLTLRQARLSCPPAAIRHDEPERVAAAVALLRATLATLAPRTWLLASPPDVAVAADIGRLSPAQTHAEGERIRDMIFQTLGVVPVLALAAHPAIGHIAARTAAVGAVVVVPPGREAAWLAPWPADLLPLDQALIERLHRFGLRTIGAVAALPLDALEAQFGAAGRMLHQLAGGLDLPPLPAESLETRVTVGWRFSSGVIDRPVLDAALRRIAGRLAQRLQAAGQAARGLTLTVTGDTGAPRRAQRALVGPTSDSARIAAILIALLDSLLAEVAIDRLLVDATPTQVHAEQGELFPAPASRAAHLQETLTRLAPCHAGQLRRIRLVAPDARCLEQRIAWEPWEAS